MRRMLPGVLLSVVLLIPALVLAGEQPSEVPLWARGAPGFEGRKDEKELKTMKKGDEYTIANVHNPSLTVFLPPKEKATGVAVIIAPGGGHREMWMMHEGINPARWLNERGIAAFVLKYRLEREKGSPYKINVHALQDGQRAVRLVRSRAKEWGINPNAVGLMGFSAGGEVAALVCTNPDPGKTDADDPVDRQSSRPDFQVLIYSGPLGIRGAKVTKEMPPTFIAFGDGDGQRATLTKHAEALKTAGVHVELKVYEKTGHGFGLRESNKGPSSVWPQEFVDWLAKEGFLKKT